MHIWKATTLAFACTSMWLGWPESTAVRRPVGPQTDPWVGEVAEPEDLELEVSEDVDVIAAMRAGEIELAERLLTDPRPRVSRAAIEALLRVGASDTLLRGLGDEAPWWRNDRIVQALGWIGDERSVRALSAMLEEPDGSAVSQETIVDALGTTASPQALPALRRFVESEPMAQPLDRALAAVAYLAIPQADALLREWASRPGLLGQYALGRLDPASSESQRILRDALTGPDATRAAAAANALRGSEHVLHDALVECASRTDDGTCMQILAERGEVEFVAAALADRPGFDLYPLAETEAGRAVLTRLAETDDFETRLGAFAALAGHDEGARAELVAMGQEIGANGRVMLGRHLLDSGHHEGTDLIVGAILDDCPAEVRRQALHILMYGGELGVAGLRDLARADGEVGRHARAALLSRGRLDETDLDVLRRVLEAGDGYLVARLTSVPPSAERLLMDHVDDPATGTAALGLLSRQLPVDQALRLAGDDLQRRVRVIESSSEDSPALDDVVRELAREQGLAAAVQQLGHRPATQRVLRDALESRDPEERRVAISHAELDDDQLSAYLNDRDPRVREAALGRVVSRGGTSSLDVALRAARDADPGVRARALDALHGAFDPEAIQAQLAAMDDEDDEVALAAVRRVMSSIGGDAIDGAVRRALDPGVRLERREQIAELVLASSDLLDEQTRAALSALGALEPEFGTERVIQLDEL